MKIRPCDSSGDILPVSSALSLLSGPEAVAAFLRYRLRFWAGEWWENPEDGNQILKMLEASRLTADDAPAILSYLSSYIMKTPGVLSVEDADITVSGRRMAFSCRVITAAGSAPVDFSLLF